MTEFKDPTGDSKNYRWALFYFNREDKRILVPKRMVGMGFSLNFSHPVSWVIILLIIALIAYSKWY